MIVRWQRFLERAGAVFAHDAVQDYGDPRREARRAVAGDVIADLTGLGVLAVTGADTESFLQGQLTSDLRAIPDPGNQPSAWCSPEGRVLTCLTILRWDGCHYLLLPADRTEFVRGRLGKFVLRARVRIEDASGTLVRIGLGGERAGAAIERALGTCPARAGDSVNAAGLTVARTAGARPRYLALGAADAAERLWRGCGETLIPVGSAAWGLLEIEAGLPRIGPATADRFLPQMLDLDRLGAVSFTKGCYPGQEVVARAQHLGQVKRRLHRARAETRPEPGQEIRLARAEADAPAGIVLAAEPGADGGFDLLAVVRTDAGDEPLRLSGAPGSAVALSPLP